MTDYHRLYWKFYDDPDVVPLSPVERLTAVALFTGSQRTTEGLYRIRPAICAEEVGVSVKDWQKAFQAVLATGIVKYDERTRVVFIPNALRYQPPSNSNNAKGAMKTIKQLHWSPLVDEFIAAAEKWAPHLHKQLILWVEERKRNQLETESEPNQNQTGTDEEPSPSLTPPPPPPKEVVSLDEKRTSKAGTASDASAARSFDVFWDSWPKGRKVGKKPSRSQWAKLTDDERLIAIGRIDDYVAFAGDVKFMKHPERYLRDRIFSDDLGTDVYGQPDSDLFMALVRVEGGNPDQVTASQRARVQQAALELEQVGATPVEVERRARVYAAKHPDWELTATSLAARWASVEGRRQQATAAGQEPDFKGAIFQ